MSWGTMLTGALWLIFTAASARIDAAGGLSNCISVCMRDSVSLSARCIQFLKRPCSVACGLSLCWVVACVSGVQCPLRALLNCPTWRIGYSAIYRACTHACLCGIAAYKVCIRLWPPSTQNMRHVGLHLTPCENTVLVYERENIQKAFFSQRQQRFVRIPVACRW